MPRFFFDIGDDRDISVDAEGLDLPNVHRAKIEAIAVLPALARETSGRDTWAIRSRVRDEGGDLVFEATLRFDCKHYG